MTAFGTRGAARELALVLDGPAAARPPVVLGLQQLGAVLERSTHPRPEFRDALRTRLLAVAAVRPATAPAPVRTLDTAWVQQRRTQRRLGLAAGGLAGVVAVTGLGVAGSRSLPGEPLYGLKIGAD